MRNECGRKSVSVASFSVIQANRAMELDQKRHLVHQLRMQLDLLGNSLLQVRNSNEGIDNANDNDNATATATATNENGDGSGNLSSAIDMYVAQVKRRRFQLVLEAFEMHCLDVGADHKSITMDDLLQDDAVETLGNGSNSQSQARFKRLVKERIPSGIGKIGGLLLPHRGPSHFNGVLPTNVLTSSLRLIASLTNVLARCLSIELPHPIVLCPMATSGRDHGHGNGRHGIRNEGVWLRDQTADIVESVTNSAIKEHDIHNGSTRTCTNGITLMKDLEELDHHADDEDCETIEEDIVLAADSAQLGRHFNESAQVKASTSTTSLMSLVGSSSYLLKSTARKAFDKISSLSHHEGSASAPRDKVMMPTMPIVQVPMDEDSVSLRLKYASYPIIYESNSNSGKSASAVKYELRPPSKSSSSDREIQRKEEDHFTIGLQLLQNNIISLSIKAGVPVAMLWPAEAMLLNLQSLKLYCSSQLG